MTDDPPTPGPDSEAQAKQKVRQDIAAFKSAVVDAEIKEVETPTSRKQVEIAWEDARGFHVEEGEAIGVYREPPLIHIDWSEGGRTTIERDKIVDIEEGDWYKADESE